MRVALIGAEQEESLAVRYLRGALERDGHEVTQLVFNEPEQLEDVARLAAAGGFALIGLSMVFTARAREFAALATRLRELGVSGLLVAGGHFAGFNAEALLGEVAALDAVVLGEGEGPLTELAAGRAPAEVGGLVLQGAGGRVRRTGAPRMAPDLDALAWPTRKQPPDEFLGLPIVNLLASRGCTYGCAFCSISAWHRLCGGERHRLRDADAVAAELAALRRQGVRIFNFHDDNFLPRGREAALARLAALERALRPRKLGRVALALKCRPDAVEPEVLAALQRLGTFRLFLGIEAGSEASLRALGRGQTLAENERALRLVNEAGLHACFNLLLFNPDSTLEDVAENLRFLRRHGENPMNFCRTEVYAGTPLERRLAREGRLLGDFWGRHYVIADPRAQRAFELALGAFYERNYGHGASALHHLAMRVDFEAQLLEHFGWTAALRPAAKDFVRRVNASTCCGLEALVARLARARGRLPGLESAFARELTAWVAGENERLGAEGMALLDAIHAAARQDARGGRLRGAARRVAAAGLAATISVAGAACKQEPGIGTHVYETIAAPLEGDPAKVREPVTRAVLPWIAQLVSRAVAVEVTVVLGHDGQLRTCTFKAGSGEAQACPRGVRLQVQGADVGNRRFVLRFSAEELARAKAAGLPLERTHMSEMAPRPYRDAGETQMAEMAPIPRDAGRTHMKEMAPRPQPPTKPPPKKAPPKKAEPKKDRTHMTEMAPLPLVPKKKVTGEEQ